MKVFGTIIKIIMNIIHYKEKTLSWKAFSTLKIRIIFKVRLNNVKKLKRTSIITRLNAIYVIIILKLNSFMIARNVRKSCVMIVYFKEMKEDY